MSGKAADIHHKPSPDQQQSKCPKSPHAGQAGSPLSRDDFLSMQKEVQQVGESPHIVHFDIMLTCVRAASYRELYAICVVPTVSHFNVEGNIEG